MCKIDNHFYVNNLIPNEYICIFQVSTMLTAPCILCRQRVPIDTCMDTTAIGASHPVFSFSINYLNPEAFFVFSK